MKSIYEAARIKPSMVQVESHPYNPEWELLEFCQQNGIVLQVFAPLGHSMTPNLLDDSVVTAIAAEVN
ncbi:aldo/keto reductase, partial [Acinetobacter baumannii]